MIAEFRLYNSKGARNPVAYPDKIHISVSDDVSLKAIDGVLGMLKVHRDRIAADMPKFENLDGNANTEDEDEQDDF